MLTISDIPSTLFRYQSINDNLKNSLENTYLWFSSAKDMNDPFEAIIPYDFNKMEASTICRYFRKLIKSHSKQDIAIPNEDLLEKDDQLKQRCIHTIKQGVEKAINKPKILCLSANHKNILMWSHYADGHKGLCIEFDLQKDPLLFSSVHKVQYRSAFPTGNNILDNTEAGILKCGTDALLTKALGWVYEEEFRVIKKITPSETPNKQPINNKSIIKSIYFGLRTPEKDVKAIKSLLKNAAYPDTIKYFKAIKAADAFAIDFEEIAEK